MYGTTAYGAAPPACGLWQNALVFDLTNNRTTFLPFSLPDSFPPQVSPCGVSVAKNSVAMLVCNVGMFVSGLLPPRTSWSGSILPPLPAGQKVLSDWAFSDGLEILVDEVGTSISLLPPKIGRNPLYPNNNAWFHCPAENPVTDLWSATSRLHVVPLPNLVNITCWSVYNNVLYSFARNGTMYLLQASDGKLSSLEFPELFNSTSLTVISEKEIYVGVTQNEKSMLYHVVLGGSNTVLLSNVPGGFRSMQWVKSNSSKTAGSQNQKQELVRQQIQQQKQQKQQKLQMKQPPLPPGPLPPGNATINMVGIWYAGNYLCENNCVCQQYNIQGGEGSDGLFLMYGSQCLSNGCPPFYLEAPKVIVNGNDKVALKCGFQKSYLGGKCYLESYNEFPFVQFYAYEDAGSGFNRCYGWYDRNTRRFESEMRNTSEPSPSPLALN